MKIKYFSLILMFSSLFLVSCKYHSTINDSPATTTNFLGNQVFLAYGQNFETGEIFLFNTLTGKKLAPCPDNDPESLARLKSYQKNDISGQESNKDCGYRLINNNGEYSVIGPKGLVVEDAIIDKLITITARFNGSICVIAAEVGGKQYTGCYSVAEVCAALNSDPNAKQEYMGTYNQYCQ